MFYVNVGPSVNSEGFFLCINLLLKKHQISVTLSFLIVILLYLQSKIVSA